MRKAGGVEEGRKVERQMHAGVKVSGIREWMSAISLNCCRVSALF